MKYFFQGISREEFFTQECLYLKKTNKEPIIIGIPKEDILQEPRLPFTPEGVKILIDAGYEVIVEAGAGEGISYTDRHFSEAGAFISDSKALVFNADILFKITPPTVEESMMMKQKMVIFSMLQLHYLSIESIKIMQHKKITAFAYDFLKDEEYNFSIINTLCEIEGNVAISVISELMSNHHGGKGIMLGSVAGIGPTEIVILGANIASLTAARLALAMGCCVKIFDHNINKLRNVHKQLGHSVFTSIFHPKTLAKSLLTADAVIGCLRHMNDSQRYVVLEDAVKTMKKGAIIVDISIDQGGCFETSECSTFSKPYYVKHGVIHYCIPNLSAHTARSASMALSNILANEMVETHNDGGISNSVKRRPGFCHGVYLYNGILTNSYLGTHFGMASNDINLLFAAF